MDIEILTPSYQSSSGGIRVLHYLGYCLTLAGFKVKMRCDFLNPEWIPYSQEIDLTKNHISILPEIYPVTFDHPLKKIVRWALYFPSVLCNGPSRFPKHEYVVSYAPEYKEACDIASSKKCPVFFLPYVDMIGLDDTILREHKGAVWYGKGFGVKTRETEALPEITRDWPTPRKKLIHFLKSIDILYSYDRFSAINDEALICGCQVKLWNGVNFQNYYKKNPEKIIMNLENDIVLAYNFIDDIIKHFKIN